MAYPAACAMQDVDGKTPLMLACTSDCELFEDDAKPGATGHRALDSDVIFALIKACPRSVPLEDEDGTSALEHAILSDAPVGTIQLLQCVTKTELQMRSSSGKLDVSQEDSGRPGLQHCCDDEQQAAPMWLSVFPRDSISHPLPSNVRPSNLGGRAA